MQFFELLIPSFTLEYATNVSCEGYISHSSPQQILQLNEFSENYTVQLNFIEITASGLVPVADYVEVATGKCLLLFINLALFYLITLL
jgi:hypothetical protein